VLFVVKKLITPFLLPPGIFIVLLLAGAIWMLREKNRRGAIFVLTMAILLFLSSLGPLTNRVVAQFEKGLTVPKHPSGDAIILLGGGVYESVSDLSGKGSPSNEMMARIVMAVRAERILHVPVIVSGGAVFPGRVQEAHVVRRVLIDLGVARERIIIEDKSRDTAENARYAKVICSERGFKKPLLVTSALHMPRALEAFSRQKMEVTPFPVNLEPVQKKAYIWADYLPSASHLEETSYLLHEYMGRLFYRLTQ
jgi:uncharacterized SAM-binding protein YcdF (DUF218 family)